MKEVLDKLTMELKLRGFSERTVEAYLLHNRKFLQYIKKDPNKVTEDEIKGYLADLISKKELSLKTISLKKASLKFLFDEVLKMNIVNLKTPKVPRSIPVILTKEEVKRLIDSASRIKTKLIIKLLYSSGLRVSELTNLKINDLEFEEKIGWVRKGKGSKDRMFLLSDSLIIDIKNHLKTLSEDEIYLFPGKNTTLTPRNIQKIIETTGKKANIKKQVTPHKLRHSFATHLLSDGVDIRFIQSLLGHTNLNTTQIYTHVSGEQLKKIKSPLDNL
tara:strand:- start:60541 stop:61362 length:822 start_codon:yes stop_codon:yes gene_type:complete